MITAPELDVPTTALAPGQSHVFVEVLALANSVLKTAEAILHVQSAIDPIIVRTPVPAPCPYLSLY